MMKSKMMIYLMKLMELGLVEGSLNLREKSMNLSYQTIKEIMKAGGNLVASYMNATCMLQANTVRGKNLKGENIDEFGECPAIRQIFIRQLFKSLIEMAGF